MFPRRGHPKKYVSPSGPWPRRGHISGGISRECFPVEAVHGAQWGEPPPEHNPDGETFQEMFPRRGHGRPPPTGKHLRASLPGVKCFPVELVGLANRHPDGETFSGVTTELFPRRGETFTAKHRTSQKCFPVGVAITSQVHFCFVLLCALYCFVLCTKLFISPPIRPSRPDTRRLVRRVSSTGKHF